MLLKEKKIHSLMSQKGQQESKDRSIMLIDFVQ